MATAYGGRLQAPLGDRTTARGLSQWLNRLEFVVSVDGSSLFPHRSEKAVVDDASRVRPFGIEWATSESGFSRFFSSWVICRGVNAVSIRIIIDRFRAMSRTQRIERTLSFDGGCARIICKGLQGASPLMAWSQEQHRGRSRSSSA